MSQPRARLLGRRYDRREQRSIIDALLALAVLVRYLHRLDTNALCATVRMAGESGARAKSQVTAGLGWESSEGEDEAAEGQEQEQAQRQRERQEGLPPPTPPPPPPSRKPKRQKVAAATRVSAPSPYSSKS